MPCPAAVMIPTFSLTFFSLCVIDDSHDFDLYVTAFGYGVADLDHSAGRARSCEELIPDSGNFTVFADIRDKELGLDDIVDALFYLIGDHLGSPSLTTNASGAIVSEMRYKAWGEVRYASGSTPTDYTYTGQYSDSYIKLLWYGSRHYDPELGRFIQPDSIVPVASQGVAGLGQVRLHQQ